MNSYDSLRIFLRLAQTLHFGRASQDSHISPSTLSRAIGRLESELGCSLFVRDRRGVTLTPEGVRFQAHASEVVEAWNRFRSERDPDGEVRGVVRIFCSVTASQTILPNLLARFRAAHPDVQLELETGYTTNAIAMLKDGAVDVTIAALPDRIPRSVLKHAIAKSGLFFVAPRSSPPIDRVLAKRPIRWDAVPMVLPRAGFVRDVADRWFRARRRRPLVHSEVQGHEAILALVALGCGVGVLPELVATGTKLADRIRILEVRPPLPRFEIGVCVMPQRLRLPPVAALWRTVTASGSRSAKP